MFVNFSNHASCTWGQEQLAAAKVYGEIVDVNFPNVDPHWSDEEVRVVALEYANKIQNLHPTCVMCQGEFCLSYHVISELKRNGIKVVAACSERKVIEKRTEAGMEKVSCFTFVQFREY